MKSTIALGLATVLFLSSGAGARGASRSYDLTTQAEATFEGGGQVAGVGDVNGDGSPDIAVGDCHDNDRQGRVFVFFGPLGQGSFDLSDPSVIQGRGFVIEGPPANPPDNDETACWSHPAGDVNGDGQMDLLIDARDSGFNDRSFSGSVYVVFGKDDGDPIPLGDFHPGPSPHGYAIDGPFTNALVGQDSTGLGDVNGDGLDDVAVGAPFAATYVLWGKADTNNIDLSVFHPGASTLGYRITYRQPNISSELSVGGGGDVNGDGRPDVIVGLPDPKGSQELHGKAAVVFGKSDIFREDVRQLGAGGFIIKGRKDASLAGWDVTIVGDMNGDGLDEVVVGAPGDDEVRTVNGERVRTRSGRVYVVWGKKGTGMIRLRRLQDRGFFIKSAPIELENAAGRFVAPAGDINGDGKPDILVPTYYQHHEPNNDGFGSTYVIFGKGGARPLTLDELGRHGYRIDGPADAFAMGIPSAGLGDIVGDEHPDIAVGSLERAYIFAGRP